MVKEKPENLKLLDDYIVKSGLKNSHISDKLGISPQAFCSKKRGDAPFKAAEVYVLCDLLNITDEDKNNIFLP